MLYVCRFIYRYNLHHHRNLVFTSHNYKLKDTKMSTNEIAPNLIHSSKNKNF